MNAVTGFSFSVIEEDNVWRFMAPSEPGPQRRGTGGEVAAWLSTDQGETWIKLRDITWDSPRNHSYVRRPLNAHDGFYAMWADSNWYTFTQSFLYFTTRAGNRVWQRPYTMNEEYAAPEVVERWRDKSAYHRQSRRIISDQVSTCSREPRGRNQTAAALFSRTRDRSGP